MPRIKKGWLPWSLQEACLCSLGVMSAPCKVFSHYLCVIGKGVVCGTCFSFYTWFVLLLLLLVLRNIGYVKSSKLIKTILFPKNLCMQCWYFIWEAYLVTSCSAGEKRGTESQVAESISWVLKKIWCNISNRWSKFHLKGYFQQLDHRIPQSRRMGERPAGAGTDEGDEVLWGKCFQYIQSTFMEILLWVPTIKMNFVAF